MGFGWRNRDGATTPEEAEEPALDAAASERLRALSRRAAQSESERPSPASATNAALTLASNPFAQLELDVAADTPAINEAYDRLSFEPGRDEAALTAARAALMAPRERLGAEVRWVSGLPRPTMEALRAALRSYDLQALAAIHGKASGVGRFNLAFALFESDPADAQAGLGAIADARDVDADALLETLDEARFAAREREIDRILFDECLADWARHAGASVALAFAGNASGRMALARGLQAYAQPQGRFDASFREALLGAYSGEVARALDQSQGRIEEAIKALQAEPESAMWATTLLTSLDIWSGLRRPIQIHEAARGLDDPASGQIFASVRSLAVDLSNDHDQFEVALRLGRALLSCFALVPIHRAALERELPTLIGNAAVKRANQLHEWAIAELRGFARQVKAGGLDRSSGLAGSIATLIEDVADLKDGNALEAVFLTLRDISIQLNNQAHDRDAAYAVLVWLAAHGPPAAVAKRIEEDLLHFGIRADVAIRDAGEDEPPPSQVKAEPQTEQRSPAGFGRAAPGRPSTAAHAGRPTPPPRHDPSPPPPPPQRAPVADDREPGQKKTGETVRGIVIVLFFLFIAGRMMGGFSATSEKSEPAAAETSTARPQPLLSDAERAAQTQRTRERREEILRRLREEDRRSLSQPAPAPLEAPPAVEFDRERPGPSASGATIEVQQP